MKNRTLKVLILGASGYIGRNLSEYLSSRHILYLPSHKELDLLNKNSVCNYFKNHKFDVVINCAVVGGSRKEEQIEETIKKNLIIFFNLTDNKAYFKKMIHLGSGAEYDKRHNIANVKEEDFGKRIPRDEYGFAKFICSKYIEKTDDIINLRIFGLYGKYENYNLRFISNAICRNILGLPITINKNVYFDYLYIDDFIKIIDYFINNQVKEKFFNIGRGEKIDLLTIANKINYLSGRKSKIIIREKGLGKEYTCDNSRIMKKLKKFIFTDFDKSIIELIRWYENSMKSLKLNLKNL